MNWINMILVKRRLRRSFGNSKCFLKDPYGKGCFMVNSATEMANQNKEIATFATQDFEENEKSLPEYSSTRSR